MTGPIRPLLLALLAIGTLLYLGRDHLGELHRLRQVSAPSIAGILLLYLATRALSGEVLRLGLGALGHGVRHTESFMLSILTGYTNLLVPRGGLGAPALYLKLHHGVSLAAFASLLLPVAVLQAVSIGLSGLVFQGLAWAALGMPVHAGIAGLFALAVLAGALGLVVRIPAPQAWQGRVGRALRRLREGWSRLGRSAGFVVSVLALQMSMVVLRGARLKLAFAAVGEEVEFLRVMIVSLVSDLTFLVSLTPAALGIREAAIAYASSLIAVDPALGVSAAVLDRLIFTVAILVLGQLFLWRRLRGPRGPGAAASAEEADA